ncbi:penicillin-binding transpeptidase domain-containing protein [Nocardiopsis sp. L17-MgMaSL7]|uniref:penicillin-binding transpeptidase domain-containing protein n=1 Tax=Nocardiopsis sp. L17-MgMaSL7 TaxID=1938893 RepID=UPI000D712C70|nr:penicillin-binding transpeptidase domain-containing protein [Nocardiopsis sp. L17-MgMaSL7]PWV58264.1 beta-lactamase class D [Nocardiopsis sp. L17-MgMaSL7]
MRTDTEHAPGRSGRAPGRFALGAAGCAITLFSGAACATTDEPEPAQGTVGNPVQLGDVQTVERHDLEAVFAEVGVNGTFVLFDAGDRSAVVVNLDEASERAVPASTFKLPNTLIALQTGEVSDVDDVISPESGDDLSLREALPTSDVPVHQEVADRIGFDRMSTWVDRFDYGNRNVGEEGAMDRFWLEGPLEISAMEQATFVAELAREELPVDVEHQRALRDLLLVEEGPGHQLFARTGLGVDVDPVPGWWVGWVEQGSDLHTFALRLEVEDQEDAELRESLGRELLVALDVLPAA